jgi:hypothetical protein
MNRRDALKTAALALPAPALLADKASQETPPRTSKIENTGILKMRFRVGYDAENENRIRYFTHVWIVPMGVWETLPESKQTPPSKSHEPDDTDWSAQLLDDGRVVAVRLEISDAFKRKCYPRDEPDPVAVAALRRVRALIVNALEDDERVTSLAVLPGGNGDASLHVAVWDGVERPGRMNAINPEFYVELKHQDD